MAGYRTTEDVARMLTILHKYKYVVAGIIRVEQYSNDYYRSMYQGG